MSTRKSSLVGSRLLALQDNYVDEIDPSSGLLNLADVMLVFACGLMVALIAYWNVNISSTEQGKQGAAENIAPFEGELEAAGTGSDLDSDGSYTELGMVLRDERTGQLYVLSPDAAGSTDQTGSGDE
jgi:hypothetical protein